MMGSGRGCLRQCETLVPRSGSATAASVNDASRPGWERALRLGVVYLGACDGGETRCYTLDVLLHGLGVSLTPRPHFESHASGRPGALVCTGSSLHSGDATTPRLKIIFHGVDRPDVVTRAKHVREGARPGCGPSRP